jgi:hypothetical protein
LKIELENIINRNLNLNTELSDISIKRFATSLKKIKHLKLSNYQLNKTDFILQTKHCNINQSYIICKF